ncbi:ATP synthase F1 subunit epsilon [Pelagibacteraceae bacterium]|jgi:F-type H+-transporting ATPase subunit epsilon|nr:ATP synthase F1 subunit epsilon [Pelagibacteraceae bacterium]MDA7763313.1 ATP synthase F1 subunit epsilon [Pelagibacteraceae bacterium]MDC0954481.1 ATP synthase F1 subunit epsilon [Pelagibacteraceae bacterium]MDC1538527.1 ATP synthase F1 subunit epsilon [Pelagibacteraceae bacterium]
MSETIQVDIVTPEKKIFSENNVLSVNVPGIEGDLEILSNHIPIITFLKPGRVNIEAEGSKKSFFISDGVLEFNSNVLTILVSEIFDTMVIDNTTLEYLRNKSKEKSQRQNQTDNEAYLSARFEEEVNRLTSSK